VSTYEPDYRDVAPFVRKMIREDLLNAAIVLGACILVAFVSQGEAIVFVVAFGTGVAAALAWSTYRDYRRAKAVYAAEAGPIEVRVTPDGIELLAATRRMMIYRLPATVVQQQGSAFLITMNKAWPPFLLPIRTLAADEIALLRAWPGVPDRT
jgi:hypothetical protein